MLYDTHHARVYAYVVSRAGRALADEVVSETFLVAWRRLDDIPPQPLPWLLVVARNVLRERIRETQRLESLAAELRAWAETAEQAAGDVADGVVERASVLHALGRLSDEDREVLLLRAWHGLSSREAAAVLGCSRAAYFVRLHRARRRLESALAAAGDTPPRSAPPSRPAHPHPPRPAPDRTPDRTADRAAAASAAPAGSTPSHTAPAGTVPANAAPASATPASAVPANAAPPHANAYVPPDWRAEPAAVLSSGRKSSR